MLNNGINIFTDGSVTRNGYPDSYGACSFVLLLNNILIKEYAEFYTGITNNQMEMSAVIKALQYTIDNNLQNNKIYIYSDSLYVVNGSKGLKTLKNNKWMRGKSPVANATYWQDIYNLLQQFNKIEFLWVKGHNKSIDIFSEYNEMCDMLCTNIIEANGGKSFENSAFYKKLHK